MKMAKGLKHLSHEEILRAETGKCSQGSQQWVEIPEEANFSQQCPVTGQEAMSAN